MEILFANRHTLDFPNHTHNTFNIALVVSQSFNAKLQDKFLQAPIGSICITNPDEIHATPCDKNIGNTFITYYISPEVFKSLNHNKEVFFKDKIIYNSTLFKELYVLSLTSASLPSQDFEKKLLSCLQVLMIEYSCEIHFKHQHLQLFTTFIEETPLEKFSLDKTARNFGLDKYKFLRLFKQETGLTPNHYISLKRINTAKKLLLENDDLLEIAISTGFYDTAHFCKEFKRYTGVTPTVYKIG